MSGKFIWTRDTNGMPVYIVPFTFHRCKLARQMLWSCHMLCSHMICLFMPLRCIKITHFIRCILA